MQMQKLGSKYKHIFGFHAVSSLLLHAPEQIQLIYLQNKKYDEHSRTIIKQAKQFNIPIKYLPRDQIGEMVFHANHQGFVAEVITKSNERSENDLESIFTKIKPPYLFLILDGVQDPHNLGACLRTANAAGVTAVIAPKDKAVGLTPAVYKVASGAAEVTPFIQVTNLARSLRLLKDNNVWLYGALAEAKQTIFDMKFSGSTGIILGAEGTGLRRLTRESCDFLMRIPMFGLVSSLNVSVATGICLFETVRQRAVACA